MIARDLFTAWQRRYGDDGWGQSWWLAHELLERWGIEGCIECCPIIHDGLGFYGILIQQKNQRDEVSSLGRFTICGDVENWHPDRGQARELELSGDRALMMSLEDKVQASIQHLNLRSSNPCAWSPEPLYRFYFNLMMQLALRVPHAAIQIYPEEETRVSASCSTWTWVLYHAGNKVLLEPRDKFRGIAEIPFFRDFQNGVSVEKIVHQILGRLGIKPYASLQQPLTNLTYNLNEHTHRFAAWCAARAAGRGLAGFSNSKGRNALEFAGLYDLMKADPKLWPTTAAQFDSLHLQWCEKVSSFLQNNDVPKASFGHAAKLVAIYLKVFVICGYQHEHPMTKHVHPPIDSLLLKELSKHEFFSKEHRRLWRETRWTKASSATYEEIIRSLRKEKLHSNGFWKIESYWDIEN